jgi:hypothetical protein
MELDNSMSRGKKGRTPISHYAANLGGKKARSLDEHMKLAKPLCMRQWLVQIQEMEKMMIQELR